MLPNLLTYPLGSTYTWSGILSQDYTYPCKGPRSDVCFFFSPRPESPKARLLSVLKLCLRFWQARELKQINRCLCNIQGVSFHQKDQKFHQRSKEEEKGVAKYPAAWSTYLAGTNLYLERPPDCSMCLPGICISMEHAPTLNMHLPGACVSLKQEFT